MKGFAMNAMSFAMNAQLLAQQTVKRAVMATSSKEQAHELMTAELATLATMDSAMNAQKDACLAQESYTLNAMLVLITMFGHQLHA